MNPTDPVPDIPEAIEAIKRALKTCGFNWITGQAALELLRSANGEEVTWS
jgi:glutamyl/glutaminyl-tRNA synthetase